ncbi:MAG: hypothetical protein FIA92_05400 [Chloroflexi bacterium]|nr:hypothetical protein [Chloroflexota bacterium]
MVNVLAGGFLVVHGLITTMIGVGGVTGPDKPPMALPSWFSWWPGPFGRSWLFDGLGLGAPAAIVGGLIWLAAGLLLIGAGLGFLGVPVVRDAWPLLALVGAGIGLVALALYFHPIYLGAVAIDVVLVALVWNRVTAPA